MSKRHRDNQIKCPTAVTIDDRIGALELHMERVIDRVDECLEYIERVLHIVSQDELDPDTATEEL